MRGGAVTTVLDILGALLLAGAAGLAFGAAAAVAVCGVACLAASWSLLGSRGGDR